MECDKHIVGREIWLRIEDNISKGELILTTP